MINATDIGKNIKKYREKLNITQLELSQKLFVSFQAVSAWERGQSLPDLENALKLSKIFGIKIDSLLNEQKHPVFAAIDGGGSKTEFVLFEKDGTVLNRTVLKGTNPNDIGIEKSVDLLQRGLDIISNANDTVSVFAGIAGCTAGNHKKALSSALTSKLGVPSYVDSDAVNVLAMGKDMSNTASVICGTGSCVFVRKNFELTRLGGWGYLFDRSGSAYDIGNDAVRHTLAVNDGLESPTLLSYSIEQKLGGNIWTVLPALYQKGRPFIASLAPTVIECFNGGDTASEKILKNNAAHLSKLIKLALDKHKAPNELVCAGGFFKNVCFKNMVEEMAEVSLLSPDLPPIYGAALECLRINGISPSDDFKNNFSDGLRRLSGI